MLSIARQDGDAGRKSRCFSARLLGYLTADGLWEGSGVGSPIRPVWLSFFGSEAEVRAVAANLRGGRRAEADGLAFEILKKAGHRWEAKPLAGGVVMTAYLPSLFELQPLSPCVGEVKFVFAPPAWWLDREAAALAADWGEEAREVARAALFVAYLERRTKLPIYPDLRFHLALYRAACDEAWVQPAVWDGYRSTPCLFRCYAPGGLEGPVAVKVSGEDLSAFLLAQNHFFFNQENRHGAPRSAAGSRLLPGPEPSDAQLCLDLAVGQAR